MSTSVCLSVLAGLTLLVMVVHTLIRVVRRYAKFPMPAALADLIDHPLRRRFQPPEKTAQRHGIEPGMKVLDIGPGSGTYTLAAARKVGGEGLAVAVDIEPKILARLSRRVRSEAVDSLRLCLGDAQALPFRSGSFDLVTMISVMGEVPSPVKAMGEVRRVLRAAGALACSELLPDPDYPLPRTLVRWGSQAGFKSAGTAGTSFLLHPLFREGLKSLEWR